MRVPRRLATDAVTVITAAVLSFVSVARGEVLCLCDEDPDGCGTVCHECGPAVPDGLSEYDDCLHLGIGAVDLIACDDAPEVVGGPAVFVPVHVPAVPPPSVRRPVPCAASPPLSCWYRSYSIRLFQRS